MPARVRYGGNHHKPDRVVYISDHVTFFPNIFDARLVECMESQLH